MRDYCLYIRDILENIRKAMEFTEGMSFQDFVKDEKTVYAVLRCIEIIGEASKKVQRRYGRGIPKYLGGQWLRCGTGSSMGILE